MWSKFQETVKGAQQTTQLAQNRTQQTTELNMTKLDIGMGLPFNVNGDRRQLPWQSAKDMHYRGSATLSPLMPLGT